MKGSPASPFESEDAVARAREAAFLNPDDARAFARLGLACLAAGRLAPAIEALQRAARIEPENASVRVHLGRAWLAAAEPDKAIFHLRRAVDLDPGDELGARALLAEAEQGAADLSPAFVRNLFDQYAERYDSELTKTLAYRAPDALRDLAARVVGPPEAALDVLDLGCGTGLSGQAFRAFARALVGADLSPRMAEKARARGIYDHVLVGDMISALSESPASFDLVLAVDALGYVGDLAPVFRAARNALRQKGFLAATVEESAGEPPGSSTRGFILGPARRFRHGAAYVRRTAAAARFELLALEKTELRRDRGRPVAGLAFILGT
ncbi:MAG: methyltransferase domain-containing protein [Rhodospirillales bacterium]|nr:methyltransferase domain-containing protein [Rhodospirillales bacterium]